MKIENAFGKIAWFEVDTDEPGFENYDGYMIDRVDILPDHRRQGHGTALVEAVMEATKGHDLYLVVEPGNGIKFHELVEFYEGLGFEAADDSPPEIAIMVYHG